MGNGGGVAAAGVEDAEGKTGVERVEPLQGSMVPAAGANEEKEGEEEGCHIGFGKGVADDGGSEREGGHDEEGKEEEEEEDDDEEAAAAGGRHGVEGDRLPKTTPVSSSSSTSSSSSFPTFSASSGCHPKSCGKEGE